jgi:predicted aminopeptidase
LQAGYPVNRQSSSHWADGRILGTALLLAVAVLLDACYYVQAARGQLDLMNRGRPINELMADENLPDSLRDRLQTVLDARDFAVNVLFLPDNGSYRKYADLERDYVVWNVFAAPEFSLEPKQWCYPIAGCVAYRGYFSESSARKLAANLESGGFDVVVSGVAAYSTLGRFADPVLNTMMRWTDDELVTTLFHELAHQKLYVKGDAQFNESFATVVAATGLDRWKAARNETTAPDFRKGRRTAIRKMLILLTSARSQLEVLYASGVEQSAMRREKLAIFESLAIDLDRQAADAGLASRWPDGTLNNARLASIGLYEGRVEAFNALLGVCRTDLPCFYSKTARLAGLKRAERDAELDQLGPGGMPGN